MHWLDCPTEISTQHDQTGGGQTPRIPDLTDATRMFRPHGLLDTGDDCASCCTPTPHAFSERAATLGRMDTQTICFQPTSTDPCTGILNITHDIWKPPLHEGNPSPPAVATPVESIDLDLHDLYGKLYTECFGVPTTLASGPSAAKYGTHRSPRRPINIVATHGPSDLVDGGLSVEVGPSEEVYMALTSHCTDRTCGHQMRHVKGPFTDHNFHRCPSCGVARCHLE